MQESLTFTIITPTLMRASLSDACASLDKQSYTNWNHLVVVDDPKAGLPPNTDKRKWFKCSKCHHNVGNTCRHEMFRCIPANTDYILYLDDDNYYAPDALTLLNAELLRRAKPSWGTFPMLRFGKLFITPRPVRNAVDTGQIYHKPVIDRREIMYPPVNEYAGDARLVESLWKITKPTVLDKLPPLLIMPIRSYGAPAGYSVVIPNKFEDVIKPLVDSIRATIRKMPQIVIVSDNHDRDYGFEHVRVDGKFIFSRSANVGINHVAPNDVILLNDDARIVTPDVFHKLFELAYTDPLLGILSPLIDGGCGNAYMDLSKFNEARWRGLRNGIMTRSGTGFDYVSFVCAYIKRQLLDEIGLMDENFISYGRDDADLCVRAVTAGWKIGITKHLIVRHGEGGPTPVRGKNWSTSYKLTGVRDRWANSDYFHVKYPKDSKPMKIV